MRNKAQLTLFGILVAVGLALAPSAFARSHWNVGVNLGFPGVSIGYSGNHGHHRGHGYGWGGNYYGGGHYGYGLGYRGGYYSSYAAPAYYGGYYGGGYYGPSYSYGASYRSYPVSRVVYYDQRPVRRVYRSERHYSYRDDDDRGHRGDYANRATYYDRGEDYRR